MGSSSSKAARDPWAACQAGALGPLAQWLDSGGNPNAVDSTAGRGSLLHVAAAAGHAACIKLLVQRGANVNLDLEGVGTPLHAAAARGANTTALLLDYGASPDARFQGRTAAEVAEANGFPDTASLIRLHMMEHQQGSLESGGGGADVHAPPATVDSGAAGLDVSSDSSDADLDDPLLSFVRGVMLKRPPPAGSGGPEVPQPSAALPAPSGDDSGKAAGEGEAPPGTSGMPGTVGRPSLAAANAGSRAKKLAQIRERMLMASLDEVHHEPYLSRWMAPGLPMWMPLPQAQDSEQGQAAASPAGDGGRPAVPAGSGTGTGVDAPAGSAPASPAPGSAQLPGSGAVQVSAVQQQGSRPLGAAGGSGSPQPGSPQPSGPPTPGRRPQQGPSAPSLLQALCCCSSAVIPASSRDAVHFAVDFRAWSVNFEDLHMQQFIGKGSYGKVYRAKLHETLVAVKVLLDYEEARQAAEHNALHTITDPIAASLQQECGLMATLRHPNIVQFMGVSTCPPAMVTEFCSRGSLASVLRASKQAPLSWPRRLSVALDAAKGMLYLHMRGIVHRDLKSPNLLVDATWRCKVADFNLSKILEKGGAGAEGQLVRSSLCCWSSGSSGRKGASPPSSAGSGCPTPSPLASGSGTLGNVNPRWLAPEVLNGEVATYASDVFSWGVVMWELLTLERPWENVADWPLYTRLRSGQRLEVPPCDKLPGADTRTFAGLEGYIALMRRCWAEQPDQRPGFEEVIHELRRLMEAAVPRAAGG